MEDFLYATKWEVDHKRKSALAGGKAVNSCKNAVNNRDKSLFSGVELSKGWIASTEGQS